MTTTELTYGQLDKVPPFPDSKRVLEHHHLAVQMTLDGFGIADPIAFAVQIQKAG